MSRDAGDMVKLGVMAKDAASGEEAAKKTNIGSLWTGSTTLPLYFAPGTGGAAGTVPLAFSLPGTEDVVADPRILSYLFFMEYTGTYVLPAGVTEGSFGYKMAYNLAISADDVDAATASKVTP